MRPYQMLVSGLAIALELSLLIGIFRRGHQRSCITFPVYVLAVLGPSLLFLIWPARFYNWDNFILKEIVHTLLKFAIAIELVYRTVRAFPSALLTARRVVLLAFLAIAVIALSVETAGLQPAEVQIEWHARVLNGTLWLFTAIAAVLLWYRLPVDPFHKAILVGFVPYLLVFSIGARALAEMGENARLLQRAYTLGYVLLLLYWNRAAWGHASEPARARGTSPASQAEAA